MRSQKLRKWLAGVAYRKLLLNFSTIPWTYVVTQFHESQLLGLVTYYGSPDISRKLIIDSLNAYITPNQHALTNGVNYFIAPFGQFGGFHKWGIPKMFGLYWKILLKLSKIDDLGVPLFQETATCGL